MASVKELRQVNIVGVAESLGMALEPKGSGYYEWKEHDSLVINVRKNRFNWFSRDLSGDPIALVQAVREDQTGQPVSFKEAKHYVETGSFPTVDTIDYTRKEFSNYLSRYKSKDKTLMIDYLKNERGLSEETIRFFDEKGVLGQANYKNAQGIEPVILFKTLDATGKMIGGSLQGIVENRELYDRGRLKQIMKHSDGSSGFNVDIGTPKRLIVAEAPIDLMSYYELHKGELNDVRLVAMDGLKEGTISRHYMEILHLKRGKVYEVDHKKTPQALSNIAKTSTHFKQEENQSVITLAVDNDSAGRKFLSRLEDKGIRFVSDLPPLPAGKEKSDWNDYLKQKKKGQLMEHQNKRLTQNKEVEPHRKEKKSKKTKTAEEHYFDWIERMAATVQEQLQLPSPPKLASELEVLVEPFITTDLDRLFARRLSLALDTQRVESSQILSVHQAIDQLDKQINEQLQEKELQTSKIAEDYLLTAVRGDLPTLEELYSSAIFSDKPSVVEYLKDWSANTEEVRRVIDFLTQLDPVRRDWLTPVEYFLDDIRTSQLEEDIADEEEQQEQVATSDQKENAFEQAQGHEKSAEGTIGDFPAKQEAAPLPEANESQPLNDLSPSQTQPQPLLHFTTKDDGKSIEKRYYHLASKKDIAKLNRYAPTIQQTAQWYLDTIADSHVIYLYKDGGSISSLAVQFDRDKFMHLTGIFPYREHQTATQTLEDFANGKGDFDSILIANKGAAFDKIKVLPELEAIIQSDSFYFGDLSEVPKLKQLDMDKAIRSGDEDVVLAMRTVDGTTFPASLLKLRQTLALQLEDSTEERTILGVYRYRDSQLDQLSINQEYIKDGGEVFKSILDQVVENLNQSTSSEPNMEEDMVYHNQPSFKGQMQNHPTEKVKLESVDQPSYAQPSSQNKLNELLASKDRAGLAQHLKEGIHQYLDSTQYKEFLKTMSRFPQYSYRNVMLLKAQKPDVQAVTSFKSWKEDFGRSVKKGEKSLRIFAPMVVKAKDPKTGEILKDDKGNDVTRTIFKLVPVFDVSQTEGKELPQPIYQLEGTHENYAKLYRSAKEYAQSKGLRFEFEANLGEANGYYSRKDQKIVIKSGMSEQQTLKTIYHELAHADLHSSKTTDKELKYSHAELQAESVAYIVSNHYGLDTGSYTFAYLASWAEDKAALTDLEAQLEIVQKEAQHLINSLDSELAKQMEQAQELSVEKVESVEKLSFEERLARAEVQSRSLVEQQMKEEDQSKKQEAKQSNQER
ncbi:PBECR4 domain-containing protein [Streptococcus suis]|uniref:PBECR4 domain-containing protein n=1 Tax=Streptococcus suis TaxID=1307 RepID=UPI000402C1F0|nr:PBECR4 domain-containing protein [Streptococcus suis]